MSNLSKELRARLAENFILTVPEVARKQVQQGRRHGQTIYGGMRDGDCVESVLMHYEHGVSVCVSDAGRLPHGLQVLRVRPERQKAQSFRR